MNVTVGKFAAIFYYCYSVCRRFVSKILPRPEVVAIVSTLATSLITYFAKIKFYDWIASHGGWVSYWITLVACLYNCIIANCMPGITPTRLISELFFMVLQLQILCLIFVIM